MKYHYVYLPSLIAWIWAWFDKQPFFVCYSIKEKKKNIKSQQYYSNPWKLYRKKKIQLELASECEQIVFDGKFYFSMNSVNLHINQMKYQYREKWKGPRVNKTSRWLYLEPGYWIFVLRFFVLIFTMDCGWWYGESLHCKSKLAE